MADEICSALEARGLPCWIAPRDVTPGRDYASEIVDGIEACAVFVLLLSGEANKSGFVRREVERAVSKGKPVFPVRLEPVMPAKALELFVSSAHWIDAWQAPRDGHWQRLAEVIAGATADGAEAPTSTVLRPAHATNPPRHNRLIRPATALVALCAAGIAGWLALRGPATTIEPSVPTAAAPGVGAAPMIATSPAPDTPSAPEPAKPRPVADSGQSSGPCPQRLSINPDLPTPFSCECSAEALREGTVWGTDAYTADSSLCRAAAHAGVVPRSGGRITALREAGRDLYIGTSRNGVTSSDYGSYSPSIRFKGGPPASTGPEPCPQRLSINPDLPMPFSCICSAEAIRDGTVWGTDAYTADSSLCRAAAHAGVVPRTGGRITALREAGRDLYVGTSRNGVSSSDYGSYVWSVRFEGGSPLPTGPEPCPQRLSINPELQTPFSCICSAETVRDGTVWGTDAYTGDSSLCRAALHAGALGRDGGRITVLREAGRDLYAGTTRNGVTSSDYGTASASIRFSP